MTETVIKIPTHDVDNSQVTEAGQKETITLIIPEDIASSDGIQVVTLPPEIGDLSNVRVEVANTSIGHGGRNAPNTCHIVHEVLEPLPEDAPSGGDSSELQLQVVEKGGAESNFASDDKKISIAVQANDYEIERRSGRTPARMRVIPAKFRDYKNPDLIKEEPESDEDYDPSDEWECKPMRGRGRGFNSKIKRPGTGKRGRPRKHPKTEVMDSELVTGQLQDVASSSVVAAEALTTADVSPGGQGEPASGDAGLNNPHSQVAQRSTEGSQRAPRDKSNPKPFQCQVCSKTFSLKGNLKAHEIIHMGIKPYVCDFTGCERTFRTAEACRRHKLTHLGIKLFECDVCDKKFSTNQALKEHMSRHTNSRPYSCKICQKTFRQVSCLSRHLTTHSDEKTYQCDICNRRFSQMAYLKSHKRSHTGERPFKCTHPGCQKSFAHQSDLIRHKIIHTGKKPYACDLCSARFNDASSRRRHLKDHTGTKPYACQLCEESFRRAGQLKVHLNKQHMGGVSSQPVVHVPPDASCLRLLLRDDGKIASVQPIRQQDASNGQVVTLETGKSQSDDSQLQHVQNQLQQVLMQLRQQRTQSLQDATEVDVHVVTLGPDGQVEERVDSILSETLETIDGVSRPEVTVQEVTEEEMAVQIALDEMGVIQGEVIPAADSETLDGQTNSDQNTIQNIVNVQEVQVEPGSTSVLCSAEIMQGIRNAQVQYEHTYTTAEQCPSQSQIVEENVECNYAENSGEQSQSSSEMVSVDDKAETPNSNLQFGGSSHVPVEHIVVSGEGDETAPLGGNQEPVYQYELVGQVVDDGTGSHVLQVEYLNNATHQAVAPSSQVMEVQYVSEDGKTQTPVGGSQAVEVQLSEETNRTPNPAPTSSMDYVHSPDFGSQEYYNWLSSFVELCKVVPMPLDMDLFQQVSQVNKTLSDVLANPSGVLSHKDNFATLMSISRDLGGIVNEHLTFVLKNLEKGSEAR